MPMLGTFGGGSARGFGRGLGGAAAVGLYAFTTATFTNGGQTGSTGPSLSQARSGLTGPEADSWKNNTSYFNTSSGIQLWTVPRTGTYRIEVWGARGGSGTGGSTGPARGGYGARMRGDFSLTEGQTIYILVGQQGGDSQAGGGGGGSYVYTNASNTLPLISAGGGGAYGSSSGTIGGDGRTETSGGNGVYGGGTDGNGGSTAYNSGWGGGGAGWLTNGGDGGVYGGIAYAPRNGGNGSSGPFACAGVFSGFGGGGGGGCNGGGGGGGYSGGGSGGGAGGSWNGGTNQSNTSGVQNDHGKVTITLI